MTEQEGLKFYLDAELARELRARVKAEGRTMSGLMRLLVRNYLENPQGRPYHPQANTAGPDENGA